MNAGEKAPGPEFPMDFARAWGVPPLEAEFASVPEDFVVEEILGFTPDGDGEHQFWLIEKRGLTTEQMLKSIARSCRIGQSRLSVAGLKDRQAVTRQWVSLHVPGREVDPGAVTDPALRILEETRSRRKLRRGAHSGNRFRIVLRNPRGDPQQLRTRLETIAASGVPNYFGRQRFGRQGDNVASFLRWQRGEASPGRFLRSMLLSAARAWLFNSVLSRRVAEGNWDSGMPGDVYNLDGSQSWFGPSAGDPDLDARLRSLDIHPTGPLWGLGPAPVEGDALALETALAAQYPEIVTGLERHGLRQERRPLRLRVMDLHCDDAEDGCLVLEFRLGRGAYATSVLQELLNLDP